MKHFLSLIMAVFFYNSAHAAPPYDLSDPDALSKRKVTKAPRSLEVNDLTFVDDHSAFKDNLNPNTPRVKLAIPGRSLPARNGKVLYSFRRNEPVTVLKPSSDGFWLAVESTGIKKQKSWVPKSSVLVPAKASEDAPAESAEEEELE